MKTDDVPQELLETAIFGRRVEEFLSSDLGKYLVGKAEREEEEANEKLKTVSPWRTRRVRDLQNQIWVAERFQQWLADAIIEGLQATKLIEDDNG